MFTSTSTSTTSGNITVYLVWGMLLNIGKGLEIVVVVLAFNLYGCPYNPDQFHLFHTLPTTQHYHTIIYVCIVLLAFIIMQFCYCCIFGVADVAKYWEGSGNYCCFSI
jgi:hypothetical protein